MNYPISVQPGEQAILSDWLSENPKELMLCLEHYNWYLLRKGLNPIPLCCRHDAALYHYIVTNRIVIGNEMLGFLKSDCYYVSG